jgi:hypothetical protein
MNNTTTSVRHVIFSKKRGYLAQNQPTYQHSFTGDLDRARQYITPQGTNETRGAIGGDVVLKKITITMVEEDTDDSVTFAAEYAEYDELLREAKTIGLDEMIKSRYKRLRDIEGMFGWERYRRPVGVDGVKESSKDVRARILANWQKRLDDDAA